MNFCATILNVNALGILFTVVRRELHVHCYRLRVLLRLVQLLLLVAPLGVLVQDFLTHKCIHRTSTGSSRLMFLLTAVMCGLPEWTTATGSGALGLFFRLYRRS